jgi:FAD/FMN-containing dehydrogenase
MRDYEVVERDLKELMSRCSRLIGESNARFEDPGGIHVTDWGGRSQGFRSLVLSPANAHEVAQVIAECAAMRAPVVTQGGNTGLVRGSVPAHDGCVVVSLRRCDLIAPPNLQEGTITVGAGVTLASLASKLIGSGWRYAVDLGAREFATIGGTIATNAGGVRVARFGDTRAQVRGIEFVTAEGEIVDDLYRLSKDNTGYHWPSFLCGSEGTLGLITAATLRLIPERAHRRVALLGFADAESAISGAWALWRSCEAVEAVELMSSTAARLVAEPVGHPFPIVESPWALLVEAAGDDDPTPVLAAAVAEVHPHEVAVADDAAAGARFWQFRDRITEALRARGRVEKFDVAVPSAAMANWMHDIEGKIAEFDPGAAVWLFGHVCDHNLHLNVTDLTRTEGLDELVYESVLAAEGSISAEHGIGRLKEGWLVRQRGEAQVALMRQIKTAMDPAGLLNPGVLLA